MYITKIKNKFQMQSNSQNIEEFLTKIKQHTTSEELIAICTNPSDLEDEDNKARILGTIANCGRTSELGEPLYVIGSEILNQIIHISESFTKEENKLFVLSSMIQNFDLSLENMNKIIDMTMNAITKQEDKFKTLVFLLRRHSTSQILTRIADIVSDESNGFNHSQKLSVFERIAWDQSTSADLLVRTFNVAKSFMNERIFAAIAENYNTPSALLEEIFDIAKSIMSARIFVNMARNCNVPSALLEKIIDIAMTMQHKDKFIVLKAIAENFRNTNTTTKILNQIADIVNDESNNFSYSEKCDIFSGITRSNNASTELLEEGFMLTEHIIYGVDIFIGVDILTNIVWRRNASLELIDKIFEQAIVKYKNSSAEKEILGGIAQNSKTTISRLNQIFEIASNFNEYYKIDVFAAIARNKNASLDLLEKIFSEAKNFSDTKKSDVFVAIAKNKNVSLDLLEKIFSEAKNFSDTKKSYVFIWPSYKADVFVAIAKNENVSLDLLEKIFSEAENLFDPHKSDVFAAIAENKNVSLDLLEKIFSKAKNFDGDNKTKVLLGIARNTKTTTNRLQEIFDMTESSTVLSSIARNENVSIDLLEKIFSKAKLYLYEYNKTEIFESIAESSKTTTNRLQEIFDIVKTFKNQYSKDKVFKSMIHNCNVSKEILKQISDNTQNADILEAIEKHPINNLQVAVPNTFANMFQSQNEVGSQGMGM